MGKIVSQRKELRRKYAWAEMVPKVVYVHGWYNLRRKWLMVCCAHFLTHLSGLCAQSVMED